MIGIKLKKIFAFIRDVIDEFNQDHATLFAAAISFFEMLSIIPLILLAVGVFGYIIGSYETALESIMSFIRNYVPVSTDELDTYLQNLSRQSGLLSGLGLLGLLWAGTQVFVILQQVMNVALGERREVGFIRSRGIALIIVAVTGILFLLSIALTSLLTAARHYELWGIQSDGLKPLWDFIGILLPIVISILAFTLIYKYLSTRDVGIKAALAGGITAGLLFELAKYLFRLYVMNIANFHAVYGSLGSVIVLVIWIYYVSIIAVLGAEVASVYFRRYSSVTK
ncbi:MAG: YihY/virulence factor BrkB family protein [Armatimonadota bacterium]